MMAGPANFCTACGARLIEGAAFCTSCGAARATIAPKPGAPAPASRPAAAPAPVAASSVAPAFGTVAAAAGMATAVPWQTIVGDERADISALLAGAAAPARQVLQRSLRRPGLSLAATSVLDLLVAALTGGMGAVAGALPRVLAAGVTSVLSLITGSKGGALRTVTGLASLATALIQVVSLGVTLIAGVRTGASLFTLAPMVVAIGSVLTMAVKTASVALRRRT